MEVKNVFHRRKRLYYANDKRNGKSIIFFNVWEIKQFFHKENTTIVEWYFKNEMNNGNIEEFDGISLVEWTKDDKIKSLKEFGCNLNNYNPYEHSDQPEFREERASWF